MFTATSAVCPEFLCGVSILCTVVCALNHCASFHSETSLPLYLFPDCPVGTDMLPQHSVWLSEGKFCPKQQGLWCASQRDCSSGSWSPGHSHLRGSSACTRGVCDSQLLRSSVSTLHLVLAHRAPKYKQGRLVVLWSVTSTVLQPSTTLRGSPGYCSDWII